MKTLFIYLPYAFFVLTMLTYVVRCRLGVRAQAIWAMVLLACFSKFLCFAAFGGDAFSPEMPCHAIWTWDWAYSGATILMALGLCFFWLPRSLRLYVLPLVAWGLAGWGLWNGVRVPEVRSVEIAFADLPVELDGYRIVQLSDLHVSAAARRARTTALVDRANALHPDLTVVTGDIVDGSPEARARDVEPLRGLSARDGVFCVTGNHEAYHGFCDWADRYSDWGLRFLRDTSVSPRPGLVLAGLDDLRFGAEPQTVFPAASPPAFRLLLRHRPCAPGYLGADLVLSGHTHGGIMPGLNLLVAQHNGGWVRGIYRDGTRVLYVSCGSGQWAGFPMRFFTPSEITLITLRKRLVISDE